MIDIVIPGFRHVQVEHLVLDFNGTLALDGRLREGVAERLKSLAEQLLIHVVTADTFGSAASQLAGLPVEVAVLGDESQAKAKWMAVLRHGSDKVIAIGNGRNDQQMIAAAVIGVVVMQGEGAAGATIASADVVVSDILVALDLLLNPQRLLATLRA